ncbi:xanthine dehydrogenase family protein subunit M [bacterium]|nr:MAG: xanthine dehydrogenase family protein subunit M [bacterium]
MKEFAYARPDSVAAAIAEIAQGATPGTSGTTNNGDTARYLGGGSNLIDLMKYDVERPSKLVDVTRLPGTIEELPNGGVRIGASVRNTELANHPLIRERYTMLASAILQGATQQLRNMATTGGNLLQRTRCYYFYDTDSACNKRVPGSGCPAIEGYNRIHAILGQSNACIATHPSDMAVAMQALDAVVRVQGPNGERTIPLADFHRLPGDTPHVDNNLKPGELIVAVDLPAIPFGKGSTYTKVRDRASYAFAVVSVAAGVNVEGGRITGARLAMGGVAHKPWRCSEAEKALIGTAPTEANFRRAAEAELRGAKGYEHNSFKIELARRTIVRALMETTGQTPATRTMSIQTSGVTGPAVGSVSK